MNSKSSLAFSNRAMANLKVCKRPRTQRAFMQMIPGRSESVQNGVCENRIDNAVYCCGFVVFVALLVERAFFLSVRADVWKQLARSQAQRRNFAYMALVFPRC